MSNVIDMRTGKKWRGSLSRRPPRQVAVKGGRAFTVVSQGGNGFELVDTIVKRDVLPTLWSKMAR
jgi:hypothetical protein